MADITDDTVRCIGRAIDAPTLADQRLYLRSEHTDRLEQIERIEFGIKVDICASDTPAVHSGRLGDPAYAYGHGDVGDDQLVMVVSHANETANITLRRRADGPEFDPPAAKSGR